MSKGESMPVPENPGRRKVQRIALPAGPALDAAQEAQLWRNVKKRTAAVEVLTLAKASRIEGLLRSIDSAPLAPDDFIGITREALRRTIELRPVCEVLGANLAVTAHEVLCGSVADCLGKECGTGKPDILGWVQKRVPLDHFEEALKVPCEQEAKLWQEIQDGERAIDRLLIRYDRLALHLARMRRSQGLELEDLESVAREGVWKAVRGYRPEAGNRFSTYATKTINHELDTAFRNAPGVGSYLPRRAAAFHEKRQQLVAERGREVSEAEVYESLGWSRLERENFAFGKPLISPQSLDADPSYARERAPASREKEPADQIGELEDRTRVWAGVSQLDAIIQQVLRLRYGGPDLLSQRAVGDALGLSRDEVRRLEETGIASLKSMLEGAERATSAMEKR